jgi:hypothetical protein
MSYQAWVYRYGLPPKLCTSPMAYDAALSRGWVDSPAAAVPPPEPVPAPVVVSAVAPVRREPWRRRVKGTDHDSP